MENNEMENMISESKKIKTNVKIPLVIIGILIIALLGFGVYYYFNQKTNTQNIYYEILDSLTERLSGIFDNELLNKPYGYDSTITLNVNSTNSEIMQYANILNKSKFNLGVESDIANKIVNINLTADYNNKGNVSGKLYIYDNTIYLDLGDLYDKPIKVYSDPMISELWQNKNNDDIKTIVEEFSKELKNSLKSEYFTKSEETINVMGKDVKTTKHTMTLNSTSLKEIQTSFLINVKNNKKLVSALSNVSNTDKKEIVESIEDSIKNVEELNGSLVTNIYVSNTGKVEQIEVILKDEEEEYIINYNKVAENTYEVVIGEVKFGTITISNDTYEINYDLDDTSLNIKYTNKNNNVNFEFYVTTEDIALNLKLKNDNNKNGSLEIKVNSMLIEGEAVMKIDFNQKELNSVSKKDVTNAINLENMTDEDTNLIMLNLYQNASIAELFKDMMNFE